MKYLWIIALLLPIESHAIVATVTNTFVAGQKIVASQVNQNFNDVLSAINGQLADQNIVNGGINAISLGSYSVTNGKLATGSVTYDKMATGANYYIANYRKGCRLQWNPNATTSVYVSSPCELVVDGSYGQVTASQTVSQSSIDTGGLFPTATATVYYIYGKPSAGSINFQISASTPTVTSARKPSDSTQRYIGSFVINNGSILGFHENGNSYTFGSAFSYGGGIAPMASSTSIGIYLVPPFSEYIKANLVPSSANTSGTGVCNAIFVRDQLPPTVSQETVYVDINTNAAVFQKYQDIPMTLGNILLNGYNCVAFSGTYFLNTTRATIQGYEEPKELY